MDDLVKYVYRSNRGRTRSVWRLCVLRKDTEGVRGSQKQSERERTPTSIGNHPNPLRTITDRGMWPLPHGPLAQKVVHKDEGCHCVNDRNGAREHARIVSA